jgi:integrase
VTTLWDADGKHTRVLGRAWAKNSGKRTPRGAIVWHVADGPKPEPSYLTPREAQGRLRRLLEHEATTVATPASAKGTPLTFADAAKAWLLHGERKRALKRSTLADYRQALDAYLLPAPADRTRPDTAYGRAPFATTPLREIRSTQLKEWYEGLPYGRTAEKLLMIVRAILGHARSRGWVEADPSGTLERYGELVTPKSGKVRSVPMVPEVAQPLARLSQREHFPADHDPVFTGTAGGHPDASALRRRYARAAKRADLRPLPFHPLRHYFGSMAVNQASLVQVQSSMGHSEIQTTARYPHAKNQAHDAAILASAFKRPSPTGPEAASERSASGVAAAAD